MEWMLRKYIEQIVKDPEYSEPKWFISTGADQTLYFPSAVLIYINTLIVPIVDGGATGIDMIFYVNGIALIRWQTGIGLQSDVKLVPLNYLSIGQSIVLSLADGTIGDWSIQLTTISEKAK